MTKTFTVDDALFRMQAKKLIRKLKIEEHKFIKEEAGLLAQLFAKVTPPFKSFPKMSGRPNYTTSGAQKQGALAVKTDFNRAIKRMGNIRDWKSKSIREAIKNGDIERLKAILRNMRNSNKHNLDVEKYTENLRNRQRNKRGRVGRNIKPVVAIQNSDINKGLRAAVNNLGIAKATFAKVAVSLGRPNPPRWIARHFNKINPTVSVQKSPARVRFVVSAKGLDVASRRIQSVERFRLKAMVQKLERMVKAESKKKGFKVR